MFAVGVIMLVVALGMLIVARPRDGTIVNWLRGEVRQQLYGFALILLITIGGLLALS
jgi:hypothetical protein